MFDEPVAPKKSQPIGDSLSWLRSSPVLVFDIETGGLPLETLQQFLPAFDSNCMVHPGEFNRSSVKLGNLKDQAKIEAKIQEAKEKHEKEVAEFEANRIAARDNYWKEVEKNAALSPITGEVLAIGIGDAKGNMHFLTNDDGEIELLNQFWLIVSQSKSKWAGWNIQSFDVPFLVNRSRRHGFQPPVAITDKTGRYLDFQWIELMNFWVCGGRSSYDPFQGRDKSGIRAKDLAAWIGCGRDDSVSKDGAEFAANYRAGGQQRKEAMDYLSWDITEEVGIAKYLGVM